MILTGLRRNEAASVTIGSLFLDGESPYVFVEGKHAKSGRAASLPLRAETLAPAGFHEVAHDGAVRPARATIGRCDARQFVGPRKDERIVFTGFQWGSRTEQASVSNGNPS